MRGLWLGLPVVLSLALSPRQLPPEQWSGERLLWAARTRPVPVSTRTRATVRAESGALGEWTGAALGATPAALAVQRPGRVRLDVMGPLGGAAVFSMATDGDELAVHSTMEGDPWVVRRAEALVAALTEGLGSVDDAVAVLSGDVPLRQAPLIGTSFRSDGSTRLVLRGPVGSRLLVDLDPVTATPRRLLLTNRQGERLLRVRYGRFEADSDGALAPRAVVIEVPSIEGVLELRYEGWDPHPLAASVFEL